MKASKPRSTRKSKKVPEQSIQEDIFDDTITKKDTVDRMMRGDTLVPDAPNDQSYVIETINSTIKSELLKHAATDRQTHQGVLDHLGDFVEERTTFGSFGQTSN